MLSDKPLRWARLRPVTVRVHQGIYPTKRRWKIARLVAVTDHIRAGIKSTVSAVLDITTNPVCGKLSLGFCMVYKRQDLQK